MRVLRSESDSDDEHAVVTTKDLITYAFQVARGMEYLASRKVRVDDDLHVELYCNTCV